MNKKTYSKAYNQQKQELRDAIKRFSEQNPERFAELQAQAQDEVEHPQPRIIVSRYPTKLRNAFDVDEFIRSNHTPSYYIHTKDCWEDEHLYFESLDNETPEEVLTRRHPKFTVRNEVVTKVEPCICPLCT